MKVQFRWNFFSVIFLELAELTIEFYFISFSAILNFLSGFNGERFLFQTPGLHIRLRSGQHARWPQRSMDLGFQPAFK